MLHPGRGNWDRALPRDERRSAQRRRILDATAFVCKERGAATTVADIVQRAVVGRNSFYEHFADLAAALAEVRSGALDAVERSLVVAATTARTPLERLRALASAWIEVVCSEHDVGALIRAGESRERTLLRRRLTTALRAAVAEARSAGAVGTVAEPVRVACLVGAFEAAALLTLGDPSTERSELVETLVDLTVRAFR